MQRGLMLRLGNIDYSNCYPIHGPVLEGDRPEWLTVVDGTPSELNGLLATGGLDLAPGSSIELARHAREYAALRGLCIGSDGPVESIILATRHPPEELDGRPVALPTASATSRILLKILLETRLGIEPRWLDFDQRSGDPLERRGTDGRGTGDRTADAALFIGDVALRRQPGEGEAHVDLGAEWKAWTGLPFVYALWLVARSAAGSGETEDLHRRFLAQRDSVAPGLGSLAERAAPRFGFPPERLRSYWARIRYDLDPRMLAGLERFLSLAADLGEAPPPTDLRFVP
jgi:chorismate dehydratase